MKTVNLLLSFSFVLVFTVPITNTQHYLLQKIINGSNETLKGGLETLLDSLVPAGFDKSRCSEHGPEDFCIAMKILSAINHTQYGIQNPTWIISRALTQYNKFHQYKCTVKENGDEEELRTLLENLRSCAQVIYSRPQIAERTDGKSVNSA